MQNPARAKKESARTWKKGNIPIVQVRIGGDQSTIYGFGIYRIISLTALSDFKIGVFNPLFTVKRSELPYWSDSCPSPASRLSAYRLKALGYCCMSWSSANRLTSTRNPLVTSPAAFFDVVLLGQMVLLAPDRSIFPGTMGS